MSNAKEEYQEELVEYLRYATHLEFGDEVSRWIHQHYRLINECSFHLCKGFSHRGIKDDYIYPSLDAHLVADVKNVKDFAFITGWFIRYKTCFEIFKEIAFRGSEAKLTEDEYNQFTYNVCRGKNDDIVKKFRTNFIDTPLREWPDKIREFSTTVTIKDAANVTQYLH